MRAGRLRRGLVLAAPVAWMLLIFALSSVPGRRPPGAQHWDKLAHFVEYAILGWLGHRALRELGLSSARAAVVAAAGAAAYGISDEWHQSFVRWRSVEAADALADAAGASFAAWMAHRFPGRLESLKDGAEPGRAAPGG